MKTIRIIAVSKIIAVIAVAEDGNPWLEAFRANVLERCTDDYKKRSSR